MSAEEKMKREVEAKVLMNVLRELETLESQIARERVIRAVMAFFDIRSRG